MVADGLTEQQRATLEALEPGQVVAYLLIYRDGTTGVLATTDRARVMHAAQTHHAHPVALAPVAR